MNKNEIGNISLQKDFSKEKILLVLMPFWTPQIPPLGISSLKSYLQGHSYRVKTVDVNIENQLRALYNKYFDALRTFVSEDKRGNFYNIGHDILQNHMMAYQNYQDQDAFNQLLKQIVYQTFFSPVDDQQVNYLNGIVGKIYSWLEGYFLDLLEREKPGVLGLSVFRGNFPASLYCFQKTKEKYPHIQTVMGGAIFAQALARGTPDLEYFLERTKDYIDKIIMGEGELLFLELLKGRLPESQRVFDMEDIGGKTLDISTAPIPDFSDLDIRFYPNMAAYSSRSCPFQCTFCTETVYWGKYRKKNPKQIVSQLDQLYHNYGSQLFLMCDSLLNPIITDLSREFIHSGLSLYWDGYLRVDNASCDIDKVFQWRRGGFYRARLGVESGSQVILDAMHKKINIEQVKTTISNLASTGIKTTTYWIIGYPGETEADFQKTLDLVEELKDDIFEAECNPFSFYLNGQVNSTEWSHQYKSISLYPEETRDKLLLRTWTIDCPPTRQEKYNRINRFVRHRNQLNIPNPYSLHDIYMADERWKKLHKKAVPPLVDFDIAHAHIDENKDVKSFLSLQKKLEDDGDFDF